MGSRMMLMCAAIGMGCMAPAAQAEEASSPSVVVEYISPETFTDVSSTDHGAPNQQYLDQLRKHVMKQATAYLAPGEQLSIAIKDIDMAGEFEPWNTPGNDIRMIRHLYPPRVELRYQLKDAEGKMLKEGEVRLTEPNYQMRSLQNTMDTMRYEKALLDDWLASTFSDRATSTGLNPGS